MAKKLENLRTKAQYTHCCYDRLIFNKLRALLGGRVRLMVTGSAPINPDVLDFLKCCFCCPIGEGYGQTETSASATITSPLDGVSGHVGGPFPCVYIRLRDIPEMDYRTSDNPPKGEICFKGNSIFKGYYKDHEKTREAFDDDGWLRSGDVGVAFPNGSIKIIDRAKNIFKLQQGEYIAPEKLEGVYVQSRFIQQIFVYGDSLQNFLVAIGVAEPEYLKEWGKQRGIVDITLEMNSNADLKKEILADLERLAKENKFSSLEKIKKIHLILDPFTPENEILTPTLKIKRNIAKKTF